jgi:hypothetical protein
MNHVYLEAGIALVEPEAINSNRMEPAAAIALVAISVPPIIFLSAQ